MGRDSRGLPRGSQWLDSEDIGPFFFTQHHIQLKEEVLPFLEGLGLFSFL